MHTASSLCWVDGGGQGELQCLQAGGSLNVQQRPHLLLFLKHQRYQPKLFLLFFQGDCRLHVQDREAEENQGHEGGK